MMYEEQELSMYRNRPADISIVINDLPLKQI